MNPDALDQLEENHDDATIAFNRAEHAHRVALGRTYRSDDARTVAVREAEEDMLAAATALSTASDALSRAVLTERETVSTPDFGFAASALRTKPQVAALLRADIAELPLDVLATDLRSALRSDDRVSLAGFVRWLPGRLGDAPVGRFDERGYAPATDPDAAIRQELMTLLATARTQVTPKPDAEAMQRLDDLRDETAMTSKRARERMPRRTYRFDMPGDRITQPA